MIMPKPEAVHDTYLNLSHRTVGDDDVATNVGIRPMLEHLVLDKTNVTDRSLHHIADLKYLQDLRLSHTKVTDDGVAALLPLKNSLQWLDLRGTHITRDCIESLQQMSELGRLDCDPDLEDDFAELLKHAAPDCNVNYPYEAQV